MGDDERSIPAEVGSRDNSRRCWRPRPRATDAPGPLVTGTGTGADTGDWRVIPTISADMRAARKERRERALAARRGPTHPLAGKGGGFRCVCRCVIGTRGRGI
jgi:hypothetical protein